MMSEKDATIFSYASPQKLPAITPRRQRCLCMPIEAARIPGEWVTAELLMMPQRAKSRAMLLISGTPATCATMPVFLGYFRHIFVRFAAFRH